jgi:predicted homoserine dehydrogenase-like protein
MVGAGFMGRGIAWQICNVVPGMELAAISNRSVEGALRAYREAGRECTVVSGTLGELEDTIRSGRPVVTDDPMLLCRAEGLDAIIEVTGAVELGAHVAMQAIANGKHVVLMNAELDGTVGPILKTYAERARLVITNADGDQPGVIMNLHRFVRGIGVTPVLCGNIKGLQDPYRNPTTQAEFARTWKQKPHMVTSFADGSKISFEQAIVANATGMTVGKRGMYGPTVTSGTPLREVVDLYPAEHLLDGPGIVDYVVGAEPGPGVFVLGTHDDPMQKHYLNLYKLGEGPFYCFYTPYHLCHFEVANTVARAVLFDDAAIAPLNSPRVDVVATAKRDLKEGEKLDGIGYYMTYGQCEKVDLSVKERLLPMGLAEGCTLRRSIPKDQPLTYADVCMPEGLLAVKLRQEQDRHFFAA